MIGDTLWFKNQSVYAQRLGYDLSGRIDKKTEYVWDYSSTLTRIDSTRWQYGYTNGRLTTVLKNGELQANYAWDGNGNRVGSTVDAQDRLVTQGDAHWEYDAIGHLKRRTDSRGVWDFHYDALWNLLLAKGSQTIDYVVDARGRRVGRKVNGALVQGFLYGDQLEPVAELDGSSEVVSRFVYGSRPHVPDYMIKAGVKYRLVTDHLGSVRFVVNAETGETVSRIDYDAWGKVTAATNLGFQPFGFAGGLRDDATGLVRFGARDYDPHVGRWTAKDPMGINGDLGGLYNYAKNDPVNLFDPNGLLTVAVVTVTDGGSYDHAALFVSNTNGQTFWDPGGSFPARETGYTHDNDPEIKGDVNASLIRYSKWIQAEGGNVELYPIGATLAEEELIREQMIGGAPGLCANSVGSLLNTYGPLSGKVGWVLTPGMLRSKLRKLLYGL